MCLLFYVLLNMLDKCCSICSISIINVAQCVRCSMCCSIMCCSIMCCSVCSFIIVAQCVCYSMCCSTCLLFNVLLSVLIINVALCVAHSICIAQCPRHYVILLMCSMGLWFYVLLDMLDICCSLCSLFYSWYGAFSTFSMLGVLFIAHGACNFVLLEALDAYVPQCVHHMMLCVFITCSMCSSHAALGVHVFTTSVTQCACCSMCCSISVA